MLWRPPREPPKFWGYPPVWGAPCPREEPPQPSRGSPSLSREPHWEAPPLFMEPPPGVPSPTWLSKRCCRCRASARCTARCERCCPCSGCGTRGGQTPNPPRSDPKPPTGVRIGGGILHSPPEFVLEGRPQNSPPGSRWEQHSKILLCSGVAGTPQNTAGEPQNPPRGDNPELPPRGHPQIAPRVPHPSLPGLAPALSEAGEAAELRHPRLLLHPDTGAPGLGTARG